MRLPSESRRRADSPTISSVRIAGYGPASSQVWKNGPQSITSAISARSWFFRTRRPMNFGTGGVYAAQSIGVLLARASASETSGTCFLLAWCARTLA